MYEFWVAHQHRHMFHISDLLGTAVTKAHVKLHRWLVWRPQPNSWFHMISPHGPSWAPTALTEARHTMECLTKSQEQNNQNVVQWLNVAFEQVSNMMNNMFRFNRSQKVMKCHEISWIAYLDDSRSFQRKLPTHEHWPNLQSTVGLWMQDVMCRSKPLRFAGSALRSSCSHHYRRRARLAINFYSSFQCTYCTEVTVSVSTLTKSIWE